MDSPTIWAAGMMTILAAPRLAGRRRSARVFVRFGFVLWVAVAVWVVVWLGFRLFVVWFPFIVVWFPLRLVLLWFPLPFGFVLWFFRLRFEVVLRVAFPFRFFVRFIWWHPWRQSHHASYRTEIRFDRLCRA